MIVVTGIAAEIRCVEPGCTKKHPAELALAVNGTLVFRPNSPATDRGPLRKLLRAVRRILRVKPKVDADETWQLGAGTAGEWNARCFEHRKIVQGPVRRTDRARGAEHVARLNALSRGKR